ncbi:MAG: MFS transporter, partial [Acidobacteriota bacterium]
MTDQPQTAPTHERASHPLRGLLVAQFLGAFNDNAWKLFVALLAMRSVLLPAGTTEGAVEAVSQFRTTLTFVTFTLPLMLFSLPAGAMADRVSKRTVILAMKGVEILLMGSGTLILLLNPGGWLGPIVVLGLMGAQSALFSPAKYGILPEILPHRQLSAGNGQLEMWTFMAIIAGTASGGLLMQVTGGHAWRAGLVLTCLAGIGFLAARDIPPLAASRTEGGMAHSMMVAWRALRSQRVLGLAVLGSTLFWGIASLLGQDILVHAKAFLKLSDFRASSLLAVFGLGVGTGGFLAGRVSGGKVEVGLIPLGAIGLSFFTVLLCAAPPSYAVTLLLLVLTGVASGLLVVPLNALLQWRAPEEIRGAVIALANVFVFAGVLLGSLVVQVLSSAGLTTRQILLSGALLTVSGTAIALRLLPGALLRLILILLTHTLYRLKILDAARVPEKGGALLVPNHVSFVDGLFLIASL